MEGGKAVPFRGSSEGDGWRLNYSNPFVAAFKRNDDLNDKELGNVGSLEGGAAEYVLIWRIVSEAHVPLSDIEREWTFDRMASFGAFLTMKQDYTSALEELFDQRAQRDKDAYG